MRAIKRPFAVAIFPFVLLCFATFAPIANALSAEKTAAPFTLKDLDGHPHTLGEVCGRQMVVIYFFDADSRSSHEGLLALNKLQKKSSDKSLKIWAVTRSPIHNHTGIQGPGE